MTTEMTTGVCSNEVNLMCEFSVVAQQVLPEVAPTKTARLLNEPQFLLARKTHLAGDFENWMDSSLKAVTAVVRYFAGAASPEDVEDAVTILYAWFWSTGLDKYDPSKATAATFIWNKARYSGKDLARKHTKALQRLATPALPDLDEEEVEQVEQFPALIDVAGSVEIRDELRRLLDQLCPLEIKVCTMLVNGYGIAEIADHLGKTSGHVRQVLFRARRKFDALAMAS